MELDEVLDHDGDGDGDVTESDNDGSIAETKQAGNSEGTREDLLETLGRRRARPGFTLGTFTPSGKGNDPRKNRTDGFGGDFI